MAAVKAGAKRAPKKTPATDVVVKQLRAFGLGYPGTHTKSPWPGHKDLAVKDKTFAYLSVEGEPLKISCKLPRSSEMALMFPFATPTPYGLGKAGWVTAQFAAGDQPPVELLQAWIDESYRAQASKKLVAALDAGKNSGEASAKKPPSKAPGRKKRGALRESAPRKATPKARPRT